MKFIAAAFGAALCLLGHALPVAAQDVTLTSRDKSIEISGNLLGFDGTYYRVETVYGELTVDGTGVLCEGPACPNLQAYVGELTFSGTPAIGRVLLPALIEGFARGNGYAIDRSEIGESLTIYALTSENDDEPVGVFTIKQTSNDEGFADILSNEADIAMSLRPASPEEIAFATEAGYGNLTGAAQHDVVAMDALVPTVDIGSGVTFLSMNQISRLLSGDISNWRELGADSDAPIQVVMSGSANDVLQPISLVMHEYGLKEPKLPNLQVLEKSPLSVSFSFSSAIGDDRRAVSVTDSCGIASAIGPRAIKTMEYPLSVPMYLYRPMLRLPKIGQDFFDFLDGQSAKRVVERAGYQAIDASESVVEVQGRRLANAIALVSPDQLSMLQDAVAELNGRRLLGMVFRFDPNTQDYDATSSTGMKRLVRLAESGALDGKSLMFAGFGTVEGVASRVAQDFQSEFPADTDVVGIAAKYFGDVMPVACPDAMRGQYMNTRVEIWVR